MPTTRPPPREMSRLRNAFMSPQPSPVKIELIRPTDAAAAQRAPWTTDVRGCVRTPTVSGRTSDPGAMCLTELGQPVAQPRGLRGGQARDVGGGLCARGV